MSDRLTFELHLARKDDLLRQAANERLAREARRGRAPKPRRIFALPKRKGADVSEPFILFTEHTVKDGRPEELERLAARSSSLSRSTSHTR
jgi:hypothetical protein